MDITIQLNEEDLDHFRRVMEQVHGKNADLSASEICARAAALLERVRGSRVPDFVSDRMRHLVSLIGMVQDDAWGLNEEERKRVLAALTYFGDPHDDIIPDAAPVFGFLDDAIMIELVLRELRPELEAYEEFCVFRASEAARRGVELSSLKRDEWLNQRREELLDRMRRRRGREGGLYAGGKSFSLFTMR